MGKLYVPSRTLTPVDRVRKALDRAEKVSTNPRGAGPEALHLLHLFDQIARDLEQLEQEDADVRAENARCVDGRGWKFDLVTPSGRVSVEVAGLGETAWKNALAAAALLHHVGLEREDIRSAVNAFTGARRRLTEKARRAGVTVVDDFAHHPTAVRGSVAAAKKRFNDRRLIAVIEPRTNTSRRAVFQDDYAHAFDEADSVVV